MVWRLRFVWGLFFVEREVRSRKGSPQPRPYGDPPVGGEAIPREDHRHSKEIASPPAGLPDCVIQAGLPDYAGQAGLPDYAGQAGLPDYADLAGGSQ